MTRSERRGVYFLYFYKSQMELLKSTNEKLLLHSNFFDENYDLTTSASRKRYQLRL